MVFPTLFWEIVQIYFPGIFSLKSPDINQTVCPAFKKGDINENANYRKIYFVCNLVKVLKINTVSTIYLRILLHFLAFINRWLFSSVIFLPIVAVSPSIVFDILVCFCSKLLYASNYSIIILFSMIMIFKYVIFCNSFHVDRSVVILVNSHLEVWMLSSAVQHLDVSASMIFVLFIKLAQPR